MHEGGGRWAGSNKLVEQKKKKKKLIGWIREKTGDILKCMEQLFPLSTLHMCLYTGQIIGIYALEELHWREKIWKPER